MNETHHNRDWRIRNPDKVRAHTAVNNAVREGRLARQPCEVCGEISSHAHHDDYSKVLDVRWLCHLHHEQAHHGDTRKPERKYIRKTITWPNRSRYRPSPKRDQFRFLALEMHEKGNTYGAIASALNISRGTAYKWIKQTTYS